MMLGHAAHVGQAAGAGGRTDAVTVVDDLERDHGFGEHQRDLDGAGLRMPCAVGQAFAGHGENVVGKARLHGQVERSGEMDLRRVAEFWGLFVPSLVLAPVLLVGGGLLLTFGRRRTASCIGAILSRIDDNPGIPRGCRVRNCSSVTGSPIGPPRREIKYPDREQHGHDGECGQDGRSARHGYHPPEQRQREHKEAGDETDQCELLREQRGHADVRRPGATANTTRGSLRRFHGWAATRGRRGPRNGQQRSRSAMNEARWCVCSYVRAQ
jgi:hypothetical protein